VSTTISPDLISSVRDRVVALHLPRVEPSVARRPARPIVLEQPADLAHLLDHTLLGATATEVQIVALCAEARTWHFAAVCVNGRYSSLVAEQVAGFGIHVATVIGFPLGAGATAAKVAETRQAVADGSSEIDMVIALGPLVADDWPAVYRDIHSVVEAAGARSVKVIIEAGLLDDAHKVAASLLAVQAGAAFVKTSSGFAYGPSERGLVALGAAEADVRLIHAAIGETAGIKAAGGVRTFAQARTLVAAGATRIGCSSSVAMVSAPV
jgi:deoxyribose-phosphate aldolase